jgi:hypothetical protein
MKSQRQFSPRYQLPSTHIGIREAFQRWSIRCSPVMVRVFDLILSALWARSEVPAFAIEFAAPACQGHADKIVRNENGYRPAVRLSEGRRVRVHDERIIRDFATLLTCSSLTVEHGANVVHSHLSKIGTMAGSESICVGEFVAEKIARKLDGITEQDVRWTSLADFLDAALDRTTGSSDMLVLSKHGASRLAFEPHYQRWLLESFFVIYQEWLMNCLDDDKWPNLQWRESAIIF